MENYIILFGQPLHRKKAIKKEECEGCIAQRDLNNNELTLCKLINAQAQTECTEPDSIWVADDPKAFKVAYLLLGA